MTQVDAQDVRDCVLATLAEPLAQAGIDPATAHADIDLMEAGVIDSFGILELISTVEERFGVEIDFEELDPEGLTVLGTFCRFVAEQLGAAGGP